MSLYHHNTQNGTCLESPVGERSAKVSDLKSIPQHKAAWLSEEGGGGGTKSVTPHRYLSKKDSDTRAGE